MVPTQVLQDPRAPAHSISQAQALSQGPATLCLVKTSLCQPIPSHSHPQFCNIIQIHVRNQQEGLVPVTGPCPPLPSYTLNPYFTLSIFTPFLSHTGLVVTSFLSLPLFRFSRLGKLPSCQANQINDCNHIREGWGYTIS